MVVTVSMMLVAMVIMMIPPMMVPSAAAAWLIAQVLSPCSPRSPRSPHSALTGNSPPASPRPTRPRQRGLVLLVSRMKGSQRCLSLHLIEQLPECQRRLEGEDRNRQMVVRSYDPVSGHRLVRVRPEVMVVAVCELETRPCVGSTPLFLAHSDTRI